MRPSDRRALTRRYQTHLGAVIDRAVPLVASAWLALPDYRDADREAFTVAIAPTIDATKAAARTLAAGYFATVLATPAPVIPLDALAATYNTDGPFLAVYKALNDGLTLTDAAAVGGRQAEASTANLAISTARQTGDEFTRRTGITVEQWERVAEADCCPWCEDLDGVVFSSAEAADFGHDRCKCVPEPAF